MESIRILFLSDTHIGIDWPRKPRVKRPRRGDDFWKNYLSALQPAFNNEVDCVVHGGDLLYRSKVPAWLINKAFFPLIQIAEKGIPVYVVPGNHERSHFKRSLFEWHPNLYIFDRPRNYLFKKANFTVQLIGFPFVRGNIRKKFRNKLMETKWQKEQAHFRILCVHHPFDGGEVGIQNFRFLGRSDTINPEEIPSEINLVLAGHLHRHQVLQNEERPPIVFNGSTERTSSAERLETKGYCLIKVATPDQIQIEFQPLKCREMFLFNFKQEPSLEKLVAILNKLPVESFVKIILPKEGKISGINAIRTRVDPRMIVELLPERPGQSNVRK